MKLSNEWTLSIGDIKEFIDKELNRNGVIFKKFNVDFETLHKIKDGNQNDSDVIFRGTYEIPQK